MVSHQEWVSRRAAFLAKEKEFTRLRDELTRQRSELPWEEVTRSYVFEGPSGKRTLAELFEGKSQLIVYHFMFDPAWDAGCKSCSFVADNFDGSTVHLGARDTAFAVISRAPFEKIARFKQRMGWRFPWLSSFGTEFNYDFGVTTDESHTEYNYADVTAQPDGASVQGRAGRAERVRAGWRPGVPHLLGVPARARPAAEHVQPARPDAGRPERGRPRSCRGSSTTTSTRAEAMTGMEMHHHTGYRARRVRGDVDG